MLSSRDVASGFFVLAIAIHTWLGVVKGYKMPYRWFVVSILSIWLFSLILTLLGPAMYQERYFARAAAWVCPLPLTNNTELTSASVGFQENTKMKDFGYITSGSSSSSSARSSSTRMSSSTYAAAFEASSQTTLASSHAQRNSWSCTPLYTSYSRCP